MVIVGNAHRSVNSYGGKSGLTMATVLSSQSKVPLLPVIVTLLKQQHTDSTSME